MTMGFWIGEDVFRSLSLQAQEELLDRLRGSSAPITLRAPPPAEGEEEGPPDLTLHLVRRLLANTRETTMKTLKVIAEKNGRFRMSDVRDALGQSDYSKLPGVWATLNRRTRDLLADRDLDLIWWIGDGEYDEEENYIDHEGYVSPMTARSLRSYFGMS